MRLAVHLCYDIALTWISAVFS